MNNFSAEKIQKEISSMRGIEPESILIGDEVTSTNDLGKEILKKGGKNRIVIIAESQTQGRGRLGRQFYSPGHRGLFMSFIFRLNIKSSRVFSITPLLAVAVRRGIKEALNIDIGIKWVNDLILDGKKVGGILVEALSLEDRSELGLVCGIGINCFNESFPESLANIATSLSPMKNSFDRNKLAAAIIKHVFGIIEDIECEDTFESNEMKNFMNEYKKASTVLNKYVLLYDTRGNRLLAKGVVADFGPGGELIIRTDRGELMTVNSGEITLREG